MQLPIQKYISLSILSPESSSTDFVLTALEVVDLEGRSHIFFKEDRLN